MTQSERIIEQHAPRCRRRARIELRIVRAALIGLRRAGYTLRVDDEDVTGTQTDSEIIDLLFNLDEARLLVFGQSPRPIGFVYFVFGNDGYDVIADNSTVLEPALERATEVADRAEREA